MSRLVPSLLFAFFLGFLSLAAVGCSEQNSVIEDTRPEVDIVAEEEAYEKEMEAADDVSQ